MVGWRIILLGLVLGLSMTWASAEEDAAAVVVTVEGQAVTAVDLTLPAGAVSQIDSGLTNIATWTGWQLGTPRVDPASAQPFAHVEVVGNGEITGSLTEIIWPLTAALASHRRLGILIMGAEVAAANVNFENRFVRMEQTGGRGVQSYQVVVKDQSFQSLDELKRPADSEPRAEPPRLVLAWMLLLLASALTGFAVYFSTRWLLAMKRAGGRR